MFEMQKRTRQLLISFIIVFLFIFLYTLMICTIIEEEHKPQPLIYAITPTYSRPVQQAELTRLSHIFMLLPNLHWIIVEDSNETSILVKNILIYAGVGNRSTPLHIETPTAYKYPNQVGPRGVAQRNIGLAWLRNNIDPALPSMVFFMDDDNTYSLELFREIAKIERGRVGVWPVGLVGGLMVERPLLNILQTNVIGFNVVYNPSRPFAIDMAGFAIAIDLLFKYPLTYFSHQVPDGYQESEILRQLTTKYELQPLANKCQDVLVWHTRTKNPKLTKKKDDVYSTSPNAWNFHLVPNAHLYAKKENAHRINISGQRAVYMSTHEREEFQTKLSHKKGELYDPGIDNLRCSSPEISYSP